MRILYVPESVDDNPFLTRFYANMRETAFVMETYMAVERNRRVHLGIGHAVHQSATMLTDWGPSCVFTDLLHQDGMLDDSEYELYCKLVEQLDWVNPDVVYFLDVDANNARRHIAQRGRDCEKSLLEPDNLYLEKLFWHYWSYLVRLKRKRVRIEFVCNIDADVAAGEIFQDILLLQPRYVAIMGLIGAGKTTICQKILALSEEQNRRREKGIFSDSIEAASRELFS